MGGRWGAQGEEGRRGLSYRSSVTESDTDSFYKTSVTSTKKLYTNESDTESTGYASISFSDSDISDTPETHVDAEDDVTITVSVEEGGAVEAKGYEADPELWCQNTADSQHGTKPYVTRSDARPSDSPASDARSTTAASDRTGDMAEVSDGPPPPRPRHLPGHHVGFSSLPDQVPPCHRTSPLCLRPCHPSKGFVTLL